MFQAVTENLWHVGLILFVGAIKPKYRKLFAGVIILGAVYHVYRSLTWRRS